MQDASSYPNFSNMAIKSFVMLPSLSTSHATSSMSTDVPASRLETDHRDETLADVPVHLVHVFLLAEGVLFRARVQESHTSVVDGLLDGRDTVVQLFIRRTSALDEKRGAVLGRVAYRRHQAR